MATTRFYLPTGTLPVTCLSLIGNVNTVQTNKKRARLPNFYEDKKAKVFVGTEGTKSHPNLDNAQQRIERKNMGTIPFIIGNI
jgi:hypothetical protein